jgi:hypothetical protein
MRGQIFGLLAVLAFAFPSLRNVFFDGIGWLVRLFSRPAQLLSKMMFTILNPDNRTGKIKAKYWLIWIFGNFGICTLLVAVGQDLISTSLLILCSLLHLLLLIASQFAIFEGIAVLDGIVSKDDREFRSFTPLRNPFSIIASLGFFLLFTSAFLMKTVNVHNNVFFKTAPDTGVDLANYLILFLSATPLAWLVRSFFPLPLDNFDSTFGIIFYDVIYVISSVFCLSALITLFFQRMSLNGLFEVLRRDFAKDDLSGNQMNGFAMLRAQRAPDFAIRQMIDSAIRDPNYNYRHKLLKIIPKANASMFAPDFIEALHTQDDEQYKLEGLKTAKEIVGTSNIGFDDKYRQRVLRSIDTQLMSHKAAHTQSVTNVLLTIKAKIDADFELAQILSGKMKTVTATNPAVNATPGKPLKNSIPHIAAATNQRAVATTMKTTGVVRVVAKQAPAGFNVTESIVPRLNGKPRALRATITSGPGEMVKQLLVTAASGTTFDFNLMVRPLEERTTVADGTYEISYELEV